MTPSSPRTSRNARRDSSIDRWAERVGLELDEADWARHFCRFEPLPDNLPEPLALRYHGHQFRVYNPDIGDGRGFTFAQLRDERGRLLDLGTKGSGQTPYSRHADGRLTLKGGMREVLATEMLEALGVNTSKSFALFETGEALERGDEPSPTRSAVLTRLSHGHIRIGTFQRLAFFGQVDNLKTLDALLPRESLRRAAGRRRWRKCACGCSTWSAAATATLAASYLAAGFVHGVLNSDNINITGESFDYGPWRFTPDWDPEFTAAYFDHHGLYAFGRQPEAIHWDLAQLAGCLSLIARSAAAVGTARRRGATRFEQALVERRCSTTWHRPGETRRPRRRRARSSRALATTRADHRPHLFRLARRAAIPARSSIRPNHSARLAEAASRPGASHNRILIGRMPRPARCISTRSRRSGRRSPNATTGSRSTTRLRPSAEWGRRWSRMHRQG